MHDQEPLLISRLNELIDRQLDNPGFSIDGACEDLGVSRSQLYRLVKEQEGMSLSLYIRKRRLLKAGQLLRDTDLRMADIADAVGMDSPQTFTKYFTQEFGMSPSEYRKRKAQQTGEDAETLHDLPGPPEENSYFKSPPRVILALAIGLPLLLSVLYYTMLRRTDTVADSESPLENTIAVLPFVYRGNPEDSLLAEGLGDQVHASLASLEGLKVISRRSSGLFQNSPRPLPEIARELGVSHLLLGSVTLREETIEVSVELVEASEDRALWARKFTGNLHESIAFMNRAARGITVELNQRLSADESRRMDHLPTANPRAYNLYLRACQLMQGRSREKLQASIELFGKALVLDTTFADALANRALACNLLVTHGGGGKSAREYLWQSERDALAAIRLDSRNATAYATLANGYWQQGKWEQALTTYQIALRYSPNDAYITYLYSILLRSLGRFDEAIRYGDRAVQLDPLYPTVLAGHIGNYSYAGRFEEAWRLIREYEPSLRDFHVYYYVRGFYYLNRQEHQQALREFIKADSLNPTIKEYQALIAYCRGRLGDGSAAGYMLGSLPDVPEQYVNRSILYAGLGDADHCLQYLRMCAAQGHIPEYLKVSPLYAFLHKDHRYRALLQEFGLGKTNS